MDHFGLVESDDRLSQRVVMRIADTSDRGLGTDLGQPLGIPNRQVSAAAIRCDDHAPDRLTRPHGLLQSIEHELGIERDTRRPMMRRANTSMTTVT